jgi:hypothetical protein
MSRLLSYTALIVLLFATHAKATTLLSLPITTPSASRPRGRSRLRIGRPKA